jgi:hypothetical protein
VRVRRCEEQFAIAIEEVATRRFSIAIRDATQRRPVRSHDELLIARAAIARRLKGQPATIVTEVRLRVLATIREAPNIRKMALSRLSLHRDGARR